MGMGQGASNFGLSPHMSNGMPVPCSLEILANSSGVRKPRLLPCPLALYSSRQAARVRRASHRFRNQLPIKEMLAFVRPNIDRPKTGLALAPCASTIDSIEKITRLDFGSALPQAEGADLGGEVHCSPVR